MAKYLDPKADLTFKKVFGEHKELVISFLNALLPLEEGKQVETIEYLPPELVPPPRQRCTPTTSSGIRPALRRPFSATGRQLKSCTGRFGRCGRAEWLWK